MGGRHPVGDAGVADLRLGSDEALGHGLLGDEKGPGDLGLRQPGQRPQREGNLCLQRQCRVAAGEHQPQPVIADTAVLAVGLVGGFEHAGLLVLGTV